MDNNPDQYKFPTIPEALRELQNNPKTIYFSHFLKISAFYENVMDNNLPGLKSIKETLPICKGIIFTKNSPLAPIFRQFSQKISDNGILTKISKKWFGNGLPKVKNQTNVISFSHTSICFLVLCFAMIFSIITLTIEFVFHYCKDA